MHSLALRGLKHTVRWFGDYHWTYGFSYVDVIPIYPK